MTIKHLAFTLALCAVTASATESPLLTDGSTILDNGYGRITSANGLEAALIREPGRLNDTLLVLENGQTYRSSLPINTDGFPRWMDLDGSSVYVGSCLGMTRQVTLRRYPLTSPPSAALTQAEYRTFGDSLSVLADVVATRAGGVFAFWYQNQAYPTTTNYVYRIVWGVAYRSPTGVWSSQYPIDIYQPCPSVAGKPATSAQHPLDGAVWNFSCGDSCGSIRALRCLEIGDGFTVQVFNPLIARGNTTEAPDSEAPNLVAFPDAVNGVIQLAYPRHYDRIPWLDVFYASLMNVASIAADGATTFNHCDVRIGRTDTFGFTVDDGKPVFLLTPMFDGSTLTDAFLVSYDGSAWSAPVFQCHRTFATPITNGRRLPRLIYSNSSTYMLSPPFTETVPPPPPPPSNLSPLVSIAQPTGGSSFMEGSVVQFAGSANDPEDGDLSTAIQWSDSAAGMIGTGAVVSTNLAVGQHTVTAAVQDTVGAAAASSLTVTVTNAPPPPPPPPPPPAPTPQLKLTVAMSKAVYPTKSSAVYYVRSSDTNNVAVGGVTVQIVTDPLQGGNYTNTVTTSVTGVYTLSRSISPHNKTGTWNVKATATKGGWLPATATTQFRVQR